MIVGSGRLPELRRPTTTASIRSPGPQQRQTTRHARRPGENGILRVRGAMIRTPIRPLVPPHRRGAAGTPSKMTKSSQHCDQKVKHQLDKKIDVKRISCSHGRLGQERCRSARSPSGLFRKRYDRRPKSQSDSEPASCPVNAISRVRAATQYRAQPVHRRAGNPDVPHQGTQRTV